MEEIKRELLASTIHFTAWTFVICAVVLWLRRGNSRSRLFFAIAFAVSGGDVFFRIPKIYDGTLFTFEALHPAYIYMALLEIPLFLFYIIEVIHPGWLTLKKIALLLTPWLAWNVVLLLPTFHFRELDSFRDVMLYAGEFNVWVRLLFLLLLLAPYSLLFYDIPYNWKRSATNYRWVRIYGIGFMVVILIFVVFSLTGSVMVSVFHLLYGIFYCFYLAYFELHLRLDAFTPDEGSPVVEVESVMLDSPDDSLTDEQAEFFWKALNRSMECDKLWQNPDLSLSDLAQVVGTNRTTLSRLLAIKGYKGHKDYVNRRRISEFLKIANVDKRINILETFFEVGFRSKMTALRNFREYTGMNPSQYLHQSFDQ